MAYLGLEIEDLFMMEDGEDDENDWLDAWMGSLVAEGSSEMSMYVVEEEETMEKAILVEQDRNMDFMTWRS